MGGLQRFSSCWKKEEGKGGEGFPIVISTGPIFSCRGSPFPFPFYLAAGYYSTALEGELGTGCRRWAFDVQTSIGRLARRVGVRPVGLCYVHAHMNIFSLDWYLMKDLHPPIEYTSFCATRGATGEGRLGDYLCLHFLSSGLHSMGPEEACFHCPTKCTGRFCLTPLRGVAWPLHGASQHQPPACHPFSRLPFNARGPRIPEIIVAHELPPVPPYPTDDRLLAGPTSYGQRCHFRTHPHSSHPPATAGGCARSGRLRELLCSPSSCPRSSEV